MSKMLGLGMVAAVVLCMGPTCAPCDGPDPRVYDITFEMVEQYGPTMGRIRITGIVDNGGTSEFLSGEGQQAINLYADDTLIATQEFQNLALDETVTVEFERDWQTSTEFPDVIVYWVRISYDPDMYDDGNPDNDDCNQANNAGSKRASFINDLFD